MQLMHSSGHYTKSADIITSNPNPPTNFMLLISPKMIALAYESIISYLR